METFEREVEVRLGTTGKAQNSPTERAEVERGDKEKKIRTDEVSVGVRGANNRPKRIRPLIDLIGAHERLSGNVVFPIFPETENTIWTPLPNLPGKTGKSPETRAGADVRNHSVQIIGDRKNFPTTSPKFVKEISSKEQTTTPLQKVVPPSVSSRVVYFSDNETPLKDGQRSENLVSKSGGFNRVRLGRVSSLISKSARDFNQKQRQEGSPYRYDITLV